MTWIYIKKIKLIKKIKNYFMEIETKPRRLSCGTAKLNKQKMFQVNLDANKIVEQISYS